MCSCVVQCQHVVICFIWDIFCLLKLIQTCYPIHLVNFVSISTWRVHVFAIFPTTPYVRCPACFSMIFWSSSHELCRPYFTSMSFNNYQSKRNKKTNAICQFCLCLKTGLMPFNRRVVMFSVLTATCVYENTWSTQCTRVLLHDPLSHVILSQTHAHASPDSAECAFAIYTVFLIVVNS